MDCKSFGSLRPGLLWLFGCFFFSVEAANQPALLCLSKPKQTRLIFPSYTNSPRPGNIRRSWGQILCHYPGEKSLKTCLSCLLKKSDQQRQPLQTHTYDSPRWDASFQFRQCRDHALFCFSATSFRKLLQCSSSGGWSWPPDHFLKVSVSPSCSLRHFYVSLLVFVSN